MNAQQKIEKILSEVFSNFTVSPKNPIRSKQSRYENEGKYTVVFNGDRYNRFQVSSVSHAREIVAEEKRHRAESERIQAEMPLRLAELEAKFFVR